MASRELSIVRATIADPGTGRDRPAIHRQAIAGCKMKDCQQRGLLIAGLQGCLPRFD
jgi:hypothetical protein